MTLFTKLRGIIGKRAYRGIILGNRGIILRGIIGKLVRGEANLSVGGLTTDKEIREVVNFTYPMCTSDASFMTNKSEPH